MNLREKILLIALIVVVGLPAVFFGGRRWWWTPLMEHREQAVKLQEDVDKVNENLDRFREGKAKLDDARQRSLPAKVDQAAAEYHLQYLKPMLTKSGLSVDEVTKAESVVKMKPVTPIQGVTAVGHQILTFTVRASGELPALVAALEQMQKTPFEHRIKSLTVDRAEPAASKKASSKLNIQMNIEVLLVAGTKNKPGMSLNQELVRPIPEDRQYAQISKRNIFEGALPPDKPPVVQKTDPSTDPTENTPQYVYLTHTSPDEQIAYLRNRVYERPEMKLMAKAGSGYDIFVITDEFKDHVFFRAKVLRVELRQVYIQIKDEVFTIHIGQSLNDMKRYGANMSRIELEDEDLFDRDFMEVEMGKTKKDAKDNKGKVNKKGR